MVADRPAALKETVKLAALPMFTCWSVIGVTVNQGTDGMSAFKKTTVLLLLVTESDVAAVVPVGRA